jgi:LPXTG-motif cell wall-anchored protein
MIPDDHSTVVPDLLAATPTGAPVGGLPETGSNVADAIAIAMTALVVGVFVMLIRRRRPAPS